MKKIIILLLITNSSVAQILNSKKTSQFDKFIFQPQIEWAACVNDKIRFPQVNFNEFLRKRADKNEIKIWLPFIYGSSDVNDIKYVDSKTIASLFYPVCVLPLFDSFGFRDNIKKAEIIANTATNRFDSTVYNLMDITQILYIEQGKLKSYIPWVSPYTTIYTSLGDSLGHGDYFSTSLNVKYNLIPGKNNKQLYLGKTNKKINTDSISKQDMLKELYGRNLIQTLWPYILKNKFEIISLELGKKITADKLVSTFFEPAVVVPVFDSLGNPIAKKVELEDFFLSSIHQIQITQDWYYDITKNIVTNSISQLTILAKRIRNGENEKEATPIAKIIF